MKKYITFIILFLFIFSLKNVSAKELSVCSNDCDYSNLDEAFSDIQNGYYSSYEYIVIFLQNENNGNYSFNRDYRLNLPVDIVQFNSVNRNLITIDGNGHTLTSNYSIYFHMLDNFNLNNIHFVSNDIIDSYLVGIGAENNVDINIDSVTFTYTNNISYEDTFSGLYLKNGNVTITNSTFSNFLYAISNVYISRTRSNGFRRVDSDVIGGYHDDFSIVSLMVDSSDLYDTVFSVYGIFNGTIQNCRLSSVNVFGVVLDTSDDASYRIGDSAYLLLDDTNDYGTSKIKRVQTDLVFNSESEYYSFLQEVFDNSINHTYLYAIHNSSAVIEIRASKNNNFSLNDTRSVDLLSYFVDIDSVNYNNYDFHVSDLSVATIENGKVVFLKAGEVDVTATDKTTGDVYMIHFKLDGVLNPKTVNSIFISIVVLLFMISSSFVFYLRRRND